jgi:hypothetical protein
VNLQLVAIELSIDEQVLATVRRARTGWRALVEAGVRAARAPPSRVGRRRLAASNFPEGLAPALPAIGTYGVTARLAGEVLDLHFEGGSEVLERVGHEVRVLGARAVVHARG